MIAILIAKVRVNYVLTREGIGKRSSLPLSRNARFDEEGFFPGLVSFSKYGSDLICRIGKSKKGKRNSRAFRTCCHKFGSKYLLSERNFLSILLPRAFRTCCPTFTFTFTYNY